MVADNDSSGMSEYMVSAPGKVIVFGEHAVVHGQVGCPHLSSRLSYCSTPRIKQMPTIFNAYFPRWCDALHIY